MFSSPTTSWTFTLVFALTGAYSAVRFTLLTSGAERDGDRVAEFAHLLMSLAMIGMAWAWTGRPGGPGATVQIVVFGLLALWFLTRAARRATGHGRVSDAYHLVTAAAMVWMVAAMPQIMGMTTAVGPAGHAGHGSAAPNTGGADGPMSGATPLWVTIVTWTFVVLLGAAAVLWATRAVRAGSPGRATQRSGVAVVPSEPTARSESCVPLAPPSSVPEGSGPVPAEQAVAGPPLRTGSTRLTSPRVDAGCHLLMSLGMAGMLLAML
ncbi:DUF5134 domain-containing protein [Pseudonocardia sp. RS010]|uniref:DUF5134 domain-containing protein n=1 Tax=Pseudonocardia sp. RS010 TaxID=3385979 RepID=UPI00399F85CF